MRLAPEAAQLVALAGESLARHPAVGDAVGAEMAEALAQLAPARQHHDLDVVEHGERLDRPLRTPRLGILIGDPELRLLADGAADEPEVDPFRRRGARA